MSYAVNCVQPGFDYFDTKFFHDFTPTMEAFKNARLFNPGKVTDLRSTAASMDALKAFAFFKDELIEVLKLELLSYLAAVDGTPREVNPLEWQDNNKAVLPKWNHGIRKVILVQLSLASAERVFDSEETFYTVSGQQSTRPCRGWSDA